MYRALSTYSRGGFLSIGAVAAVIFVRRAKVPGSRDGRADRGSYCAGVATRILVSACRLFGAPEEQRDESQSGRLYFWQVAIAMANDRPILGVGHAGYQPWYNQYDWSGGLYQRACRP